MTKENELLKATDHIRSLYQPDKSFRGCELEKYLNEIYNFLLKSDIRKDFNLSEIAKLQPKKVTLEF